MNQRERMLAIAVGCLAAILVLWFGWSYVDGQFRTRRQKVEGLDARNRRLQAASRAVANGRAEAPRI